MPDLAPTDVHPDTLCVVCDEPIEDLVAEETTPGLWVTAHGPDGTYDGPGDTGDTVVFWHTACGAPEETF